jgi:acylphosphatase
MKKSVRLYITGSVQGVFYRDFIKQNAEKLDVRGFVRNLEDGRVENFLEGLPENVDKMIEISKNRSKTFADKKRRRKTREISRF